MNDSTPVSGWRRAGYLLAAISLGLLGVMLRFARHDPKVAGPVSIVVGIVFLLAIALVLRERIVRDGAAGWWALGGTLSLPLAAMAHVLFWGTAIVLEPRYQPTMWASVLLSLLAAFCFRMSANPRWSRSVALLAGLSLAARLIVRPPILPIENVDFRHWPTAPWSSLAMIVPALGVLALAVLALRPATKKAGAPARF